LSGSALPRTLWLVGGAEDKVAQPLLERGVVFELLVDLRMVENQIGDCGSLGMAEAPPSRAFSIAKLVF
jgi:hypothetical protein